MYCEIDGQHPSVSEAFKKELPVGVSLQQNLVKFNFVKCRKTI